MKDETMIKMFTLGCAVLIVLVAFALGHNSNLATLTVIGLFGGEKLLEKFLQVKVVIDEDTKGE